jgi:hypothetical protein
VKETGDAMRRLARAFGFLGLLLAGCGGSSTVPPIVYVTISPLSASVSLGATLQFTETTSGSINTAVTWQVNGIAGGNSTYGTISSTGLYTPPATVPNPSTVTVTVISQANTTYLANANVSIVSGITVLVSPAVVNLQLGQTQQFSAAVTGNSNTDVTWQVGGVTGGNSTNGTITTSGLYTAPTSGNTPLAVSITAISKVDVTKTGSASVIVHGGIQVSLAPNPATVQTFGTLQFTPTISGTTNTGLTWQVNGINGGSAVLGTISSAGLYGAPGSVPTQAQNGTSRTTTVTVTAISQADATATASSVVTIVAPNQSAQSVPISLGVSGGNALDSPQSTACCGGTLGALVSRGGNFYILSSNHVLARTDQASLHEPIIQPGLIDTNCAAAGVTNVATLSQFANLESPASGGPVVDAALAMILAGQVDISGAIQELGDSVNGGAPTSEAPHAGSGVPATIGRAVAKSGRSTGVTCSTVSAINLTANIMYQKGCGSAATFSATLNNLVVIAGGSFSADGDSGSLVVTQDTADPVALLVASSDSDTIAQPVSDVLSALADPSSSELPTFVGTVNAHAVGACTLPRFQVTSDVAPGLSSSISSEAMLAASAVRDVRASELVETYGLEAVGVGASLDQTSEPALLLFVFGGQPAPAVPQTVDGFRTRVISTSAIPTTMALSATETATLIENSVSATSVAVLNSASLAESAAVHERNLNVLMATEGVQGVGIGASADYPGEPALVIYVVRGVTHSGIPAVIDGVRTQIRETSAFRVRNGRSFVGASCHAPLLIKPIRTKTDNPFRP